MFRFFKFFKESESCKKCASLEIELSSVRVKVEASEIASRDRKIDCVGLLDGYREIKESVQRLYDYPTIAHQRFLEHEISELQKTASDFYGQAKLDVDEMVTDRVHQFFHGLSTKVRFRPRIKIKNKTSRKRRKK